MLKFQNDTIQVNEVPTDYEELGAVNMSMINDSKTLIGVDIIGNIDTEGKTNFQFYKQFVDFTWVLV